MSNITQSSPIESALVTGDLSKLTGDQRLSYYNQVCSSLGLNPLTKPFDYITLNGKLTLYAKRDCTDQLRKIHGVSITITSREKIDDLFIVTARAKDKNGREDESTGAVNIAGLKGDALANAFLKSETKAKRRVTLSICGLGMLDESEADSIPVEMVKPPETKEAAKQLPSETKETHEVVDAEPGDYVVTFGKFSGKKLKDLNRSDVIKYIDWIHSDAEKKQREITGKALEFLSAAEEYLSNPPPDEIPF